MKLTTVKIFLLLYFSLCLAHPLESQELKREVIAPYSRNKIQDPWFTYAFQYATTPLEHLGLVVKFKDINELSDFKETKNVNAILLFQMPQMEFEEAQILLTFLIESLKKNIKVILIGTPPWDNLRYARNIELQIEDFWSLFGLKMESDWIVYTYNIKLQMNGFEFFDFEREFGPILEPFPIVKSTSQDTIEILSAYTKQDNKKVSCLASYSPRGAYVSQGYALFENTYGGKDYKKWYLNPFTFFSKALDLSLFPKPDTTTLCGKRIFYSQIDGDGWNNKSEIDLPDRTKPSSSEVIYEEILKKNPYLPVSVAVIGADVDFEWVGTEESQKIARKIYELDWIQPATHTYSHPFDWNFFKNYTPQKEEPFLSFYPFGTWKKRSSMTSFWNLLGFPSKNAEEESNAPFEYPIIEEGYTVPRAYANMPFDLNQEIQGSIEKIETLLPPGKKVELLHWSGNCRPFFKALYLVKQANIPQINGGGTRFDGEFPSYSDVKPLARIVNGLIQPFSSMANENEYTDFWKTKFFAFNQLQVTWNTTGIPIRLRPIDLYYHMYSGEKLASLSALKENISALSKKEIIPVETSFFARLIKSFYQAAILRLSDNEFKIDNRGFLNTLRWDKSLLKCVDFDASKGVIGQRHLHGSLYVFLDPSIKDPSIQLKEHLQIGNLPMASKPYLVSSTYALSNFRADENNHVKFYLSGYGPLRMVWKVPQEGIYSINFKGIKENIESQKGLLELNIDTVYENKERFSFSLLKN